MSPNTLVQERLDHRELLNCFGLFHQTDCPTRAGRAAVRARLGNVWVMSEAFPVEHLSLQLTVPLFDTSFTDEQDVSEPC